MQTQHTHECPMCSQLVPVPNLATITVSLGLVPSQERILRAVWSGNGKPVSTEKIFNVMYEDDIHGGPSRTKMYSAFKVGLCKLRKRLKNSGVSILNVGHQSGYRLVLEGKRK